MSNWNQFKMFYPYPQDVPVFMPSEREVLEQTVADQVSTLLSMFGKVTVVKILEDDIAQDYQAIELPDELLADGSVLCIGQLPYLTGDWVSAAGTHVVEHFDKNDKRTLRLLVNDPDKNKVPHVIEEDNATVDIATLQELYAALAALTMELLSEEEANTPPLPTAMFPQRLAA